MLRDASYFSPSCVLPSLNLKSLSFSLVSSVSAFYIFPLQNCQNHYHWSWNLTPSFSLVSLLSAFYVFPLQNCQNHDHWSWNSTPFSLVSLLSAFYVFPLQNSQNPSFNCHLNCPSFHYLLSSSSSFVPSFSLVVHNLKLMFLLPSF